MICLADEVAQAVEAGDVVAYIASDRSFKQGDGEPGRQSVADEDGHATARRHAALRNRSSEGLKRQKESVEEHYQMVAFAENGEVEKIGALISRHILRGNRCSGQRSIVSNDCLRRHCAWLPFSSAAMCSRDDDMRCAQHLCSIASPCIAAIAVARTGMELWARERRSPAPPAPSSV
ncbi:FCD domain-containing protein [Caballeronia temeraria]|uniref:FCD domain-containing protein n=1 Tax=Caballeronia temeraria TaxID=1777137 RepID=UPI001FC962B8|nr:FCD domain-containing protein [Caballeronia temeraria]